MSLSTNNKNITARTAILVTSLITLTALVAAACLTGQGINPVGAIAAVTVGAIGFFWFKKTTK